MTKVIIGLHPLWIFLLLPFLNISLKSYWIKLQLVVSTCHNVTYGMFGKFPWKSFKSIDWRGCKLRLWLFVHYGFRYRRTISILQIKISWLNYQVYLCLLMILISLLILPKLHLRNIANGNCLLHAASKHFIGISNVRI